MDRKKHLIDCGAFLIMFLYGNAKYKRRTFSGAAGGRDYILQT